MSDGLQTLHGPDKNEWRERACKAENRLQRLEPERDEYKASWMDAEAKLRKVEAWSDNLLAGQREQLHAIIHPEAS